jgi:plastocyanin
VGDVSAGDTVEFVNDSDKEAHEMVVMRVTDDSVTLEDIQQQLLAEDSEGPPAEFLEEAGFAFAMPGETAEQTVTF